MKIVSAGVIIKNNLMLLTRRAQDQDLAGYWEFPGGKQENNETIQQCLEREILEELSLTIKAYNIVTESIYHYVGGTIKLVAVEAKILDGDIRLSVHDDYEWVKADDLLKFNLAPADIPIAKELISYAVT